MVRPAIDVCRAVRAVRAADPLDRVDPRRVPAHAASSGSRSRPIAGSLVWNFALIGGGALLGDRWEELGDYVAVFQWVVIVLIVGAIGWFVWTRLDQAEADRSRSDAGRGGRCRRGVAP